MLLTGITHASARDKKEHPFRGLTENGWSEVRGAAARFKELTGGEHPLVETIISSPKARCIETAVLFAKAISDFQLVATSEIQVDASLKAGSIQGGELVELANRTGAKHLLVSAHADLVKALPPSARLAPETAKGGWFTTRPVLFTVDYTPGEPWDRAGILYCEGFVDGKWRSLILA
jgi:phosphohistidine phosphatase SixA